MALNILFLCLTILPSAFSMTTMLRATHIGSNPALFERLSEQLNTAGVMNNIRDSQEVAGRGLEVYDIGRCSQNAYKFFLYKIDGSENEYIAVAALVNERGELSTSTKVSTDINELMDWFKTFDVPEAESSNNRNPPPNLVNQAPNNVNQAPNNLNQAPNNLNQGPNNGAAARTHAEERAAIIEQQRATIRNIARQILTNGVPLMAIKLSLYLLEGSRGEGGPALAPMIAEWLGLQQ